MPSIRRERQGKEIRWAPEVLAPAARGAARPESRPGSRPGSEGQMALSPKGIPTLITLVAVLKAVGLRLSVEPELAQRHREDRVAYTEGKAPVIARVLSDWAAKTEKGATHGD